MNSETVYFLAKAGLCFAFAPFVGSVAALAGTGSLIAAFMFYCLAI